MTERTEQPAPPPATATPARTPKWPDDYDAETVAMSGGTGLPAKDWAAQQPAPVAAVGVGQGEPKYGVLLPDNDCGESWHLHHRLYDTPEEARDYHPSNSCVVEVREIEGPAPVAATGTGAVTVREELLGKALRSVLVNVGVLRPDADPTGPELLAAADHCTGSAPVAAGSAGQGERRWIPVSEPPEDGDEILIVETAGGGKWNIESGMYEGDGHFIDGYGQPCCPSHWMPLPDPPSDGTARVVPVLADDAGAGGADETAETHDNLARAAMAELYEAMCARGIVTTMMFDFGIPAVERILAMAVAAAESARAAAESRALGLGTVCANQALEIEALRHERDGRTVAREGLRAALEWYADPGNYDGGQSIMWDSGARARQALAAPAGGAAGEG